MTLRAVAGGAGGAVGGGGGLAGVKSVGLLDAGGGQFVTGTTPSSIRQTDIPAGAMGKYAKLRLQMYLSWPNNSDSKTVSVILGSTTLVTTTQTTNQGMQIEVDICTNGSQQAQDCYPSINSFSQTGGAPVTASEDMTIDKKLTIQITLGTGTDTVTLQNYTVELLNL